jgi:ubiquinone/menaquinone biosynthesis C-methylase UbiE
VSAYDAIAELYDPWSRTVTEDVDFYVAEARKARSTVVELGVGTGRIAVAVALAGVPVIGVDSSAGMLDVCRRQAEAADVEHLVDLRLGDLRDPPVAERVRLVTSPFRTLLHLQTTAERRRALASCYRLLEPGGRFVFDVFAPSAEDVEETHDRWLEREPGIWERAHWDLERRVLTLDVRGRESKASMELAWLPVDDWRALLEEAGFEIVACYGWFDLRPYTGGEDSIWLARRP